MSRDPLQPIASPVRPVLEYRSPYREVAARAGRREAKRRETLRHFGGAILLLLAVSAAVCAYTAAVAFVGS